jgi:CheY-like chemotaxis protein
MVMVVDDEPMIRRLVASALTNNGYEVVDAESPAHAIRLMDSHPAPLDLLVTDIVMPELDGCELAAEMRRKRPGLKVIFMSGYAPPDIKDCVDSASDFLQKPFRLAELVDRVRKMLI